MAMLLHGKHFIVNKFKTTIQAVKPDAVLKKIGKSIKPRNAWLLQ